MQLYAFDITTAKRIDQYDSVNAHVTHLTQSEQPSFLVCIHVEPGGILGRHRAKQNQMFFVINGRGTVSGEQGIVQPIETGQMAFWLAGEYHETRSETGLTALVIEGVGLLPEAHLRLLYSDPPQ
jgi:quercetin dioxygenase-like cupin family protein